MGTGQARRFELGQPYRGAQLGPRGTTVVREAVAWGSKAYFASKTPCCDSPMRVDAVQATYQNFGAFKDCPNCGWKWRVRIGNAGGLLPTLAYGTVHPINADRAEWISRGFGTREYRRRI